MIDTKCGLLGVKIDGSSSFRFREGVSEALVGEGDSEKYADTASASHALAAAMEPRFVDGPRRGAATADDTDDEYEQGASNGNDDDAGSGSEDGSSGGGVDSDQGDDNSSDEENTGGRSGSVRQTTCRNGEEESADRASVKRSRRSQLGNKSKQQRKARSPSPRLTATIRTSSSRTTTKGPTCSVSTTVPPSSNGNERVRKRRGAADVLLEQARNCIEKCETDWSPENHWTGRFRSSALQATTSRLNWFGRKLISGKHTEEAAKLSARCFSCADRLDERHACFSRLNDLVDFASLTASPEETKVLIETNLAGSIFKSTLFKLVDQVVENRSPFSRLCSQSPHSELTAITSAHPHHPGVLSFALRFSTTPMVTVIVLWQPR